jgi:hypothetical protein
MPVPRIPLNGLGLRLTRSTDYGHLTRPIRRASSGDVNDFDHPIRRSRRVDEGLVKLYPDGRCSERSLA